MNKEVLAVVAGEEITKAEEYAKLKEQLGILAETNDSLLGDNTVVTVTEDQSIIEDIQGIVSKSLSLFDDLL